MSKTVDGEEYVNTKEAIAILGGSKKRFYSNVYRKLKDFHFNGLKTSWYLRRDVLAIRDGREPGGALIDLAGGIQKDWTTYVRSLGYQADTLVRTITENIALPDELAMLFSIPSDRRFVKRSRITFVHQQPICMWDTYYPTELVAGNILTWMKQGSIDDIVKAIKDERGVIIGIAKDQYAARIATQEEQELLQLRDAIPVLILQRVSYTKDRKTLVLVQYMTLLGGFVPVHEYEVHNWDE